LRVGRTLEVLLFWRVEFSISRRVFTHFNLQRQLNTMMYFFPIKSLSRPGGKSKLEVNSLMSLNL
jgi:hypothetical protein